jgi:hypothetical protein
VRRIVLTLGLATLAGCGVELPEPQSAGARVLTTRCGGCHRLYAPGVMTLDMWKLQLQRMRGLFAQRGIPWMPADEERVLLEYLGRHAGHA